MIRSAGLLILGLWLSLAAFGVQRFPPPQFESNYTIPSPTTPEPHSAVRDWVDVGIFVLALSVASYITLKKRSRRWIVGLMLFSLLYFGFWRKGCVCSIGAIGNIAFAAMDSSYALPAVVLIFFLLPLIFTLFFGRGFCAAVCPLGAMQDILLIRPMRVPNPLETALRFAAYLYLAAAVLYAALAGVFLICRYDPFVTFFRFNGNWNLWVLGISFVLMSLFVGRPYCRFLCPYGVILRQLGRISKWRVTITPAECIQCRLCEQACPFNAVVKPVKELPAAETSRSKRRIVLFVMLLPVLIAVGGWIGAKASPVLAKLHPTIRMAEQNQGSIVLESQVQAIQHQFSYGGIAVGIFMGFVAGSKLIAAAAVRPQKDYQAHRAGCFACGRCFAYCPIEIKRRLNRNES